jgi:hypothetical protein
MPKLPSLSSRELVRLLEKGGAEFIRQRVQQTMQYIQGWLRERDILPPYRWEGKP